MLKAPLIAAFVAVMALVPAYGQEKMDKGKEWCTDAHMKQMDGDIAKITDADKKKAAMTALEASKAEFKKNNMDGCVKNMEEVHKAVGLSATPTKADAKAHPPAKAMDEATPKMKSDEKAQTPPTGRVGDEVPPMKEGDK